MREREEKFNQYNRPKGERAENESEEKKITREVMLDEHSRPKGQKKQTDDSHHPKRTVIINDIVNGVFEGNKFP
jgi:hypothetical protein